jgi:hypothetical protein
VSWRQVNAILFNRHNPGTLAHPFLAHPTRFERATVAFRAFVFVFGLAAYLIGMTARRRLRPLLNVPEQSAFKAVRWLPLRYGVWGLVIGGLVPLSDFLLKWRGDPFEPWDTAGHITHNVSYFLGAMIAMAFFTSIVGFVSRTAFRKRLGGSYGNFEAGRRRTV